MLTGALGRVMIAPYRWRRPRLLAAVRRGRVRARPKYETAGLATRGQALAALGRKKDGLADLTAAIDVARRIGDPALFVRTAVHGLRLEPDAQLSREANDSVTHILEAVSNTRLRQAFEDSDTVQLITTTRGPSAKGIAPRRSYPDGLSDREVEVLRLIAAGKTNAHIAAELVISVNTVQRHVGNILHKTRLENRTQAASYAQRTGLV